MLPKSFIFANFVGYFMCSFYTFIRVLRTGRLSFLVNKSFKQKVVHVHIFYHRCVTICDLFSSWRDCNGCFSFITQNLRHLRQLNTNQDSLSMATKCRNGTDVAPFVRLHQTQLCRNFRNTKTIICCFREMIISAVAELFVFELFAINYRKLKSWL